jgi:hypothetical protein
MTKKEHSITTQLQMLGAMNFTLHAMMICIQSRVCVTYKKDFGLDDWIY